MASEAKYNLSRLFRTPITMEKEIGARSFFASGVFNEENPAILDDPTYLTFKVEFGGWGWSYMDEDELAASRAESYYTVDYDEYPLGMTFTLGDIQYPSTSEDFYATNFDSIYKESERIFSYNAVNWLYSRHEDARANYLRDFFSGMNSLQRYHPYLMNEIQGVDKLAEFDPNRGSRLKDCVITIKCHETLDQRIRTLLELYRKAAWDDMYQRWILPDNMRQFTMIIYVTEVRQFHRNTAAHGSTLMNNFLNMITSGVLNAGMTTDFKLSALEQEGVDITPVMAFECSPCEILPGSFNKSSYKSFLNGEDETTDIKIKVHNVKEFFQNNVLSQLTNKIIGDQISIAHRLYGKDATSGNLLTELDSVKMWLRRDFVSGLYSTPDDQLYHSRMEAASRNYNNFIANNMNYYTDVFEAASWLVAQVKKLFGKKKDSAQDTLYENFSNYIINSDEEQKAINSILRNLQKNIGNYGLKNTSKESEKYHKTIYDELSSALKDFTNNFDKEDSSYDKIIDALSNKLKRNREYLDSILEDSKNDRSWATSLDGDAYDQTMQELEEPDEILNGDLLEMEIEDEEDASIVMARIDEGVYDVSVNMIALDTSTESTDEIFAWLDTSVADVEDPSMQMLDTEVPPFAEQDLIPVDKGYYKSAFQSAELEQNDSSLEFASAELEDTIIDSKLAKADLDPGIYNPSKKMPRIKPEKHYQKFQNASIESEPLYHRFYNAELDSNSKNDKFQAGNLYDTSISHALGTSNLDNPELYQKLQNAGLDNNEHIIDTSMPHIESYERYAKMNDASVETAIDKVDRTLEFPGLDNGLHENNIISIASLEQDKHHVDSAHIPLDTQSDILDRSYAGLEHADEAIRQNLNSLDESSSIDEKIKSITLIEDEHQSSILPIELIESDHDTKIKDIVLSEPDHSRKLEEISLEDVEIDKELKGIHLDANDINSSLSSIQLESAEVDHEIKPAELDESGKASSTLAEISLDSASKDTSLSSIEITSNFDKKSLKLKPIKLEEPPKEKDIKDISLYETKAGEVFAKTELENPESKSDISLEKQIEDSSLEFDFIDERLDDESSHATQMSNASLEQDVHEAQFIKAELLDDAISSIDEKIQMLSMYKSKIDEDKENGSRSMIKTMEIIDELSRANVKLAKIIDDVKSGEYVENMGTEQETKNAENEMKYRKSTINGGGISSNASNGKKTINGGGLANDDYIKPEIQPIEHLLKFRGFKK